MLDPAIPLEEVWQPPPWGLFATLGFMVLVIFTLHLAWAVFGVAYISGAYLLGRGEGIQELAADLDTGLFTALAVFVVAPLLIGLVVLLVRLRRRASVRHYLALRPTTKRFLIRWLVVISVFYFAVDGMNYLLGRPILPGVDVREYETAGFVPLLWIATIIVAPVFEELFFRGFVFRGVQYSALGEVGAVLITSLIWSLMHLHYRWFDVSTIFLSGIILGTARAWTESVLVPMVLHAWMNLIAMVEVAIYLRLQ